MIICLENGYKVKSYGYHLAALTVAFEPMARNLLGLPTTQPFHYVDELDHRKLRQVTFSSRAGEAFVSFTIYRPKFWWPFKTTGKLFVSK